MAAFAGRSPAILRPFGCFIQKKCLRSHCDSTLVLSSSDISVDVHVEGYLWHWSKAGRGGVAVNLAAMTEENILLNPRPGSETHINNQTGNYQAGRFYKHEKTITDGHFPLGAVHKSLHRY